MTAARLTGPTFFAGVFFVAVAVLLALLNWRKDWLDDHYPLMHWPCTWPGCMAEFADRDPDRLDKAIRDHRLAHEADDREDAL